MYSNVTAAASQDPDEIRERLIEQITYPVRWSQSIVAMHGDGAESYIETGAGRVLSGLIRRILDRKTPIVRAGTLEEIETIVKNG